MDFLHTPPFRCLGVDVAKDNLVASDGKRIITFANNRCGIRKLLKTMQPDFIICEQTGGYELMLLEGCLKAGIACHRADVMKLKAYIRSLGTLGKSDAIDATHMAAYGYERWARLALWHAPDPDEVELQALVRRRADLVAFKVAEQNRAGAPGAKAVAASFKAMLAAIKRQIDMLDSQIAALVARSVHLARRIRICTTVSGVGTISAASLIAQMPELGYCIAVRPQPLPEPPHIQVKAETQKAGDDSAAEDLRSKPRCSCRQCVPHRERDNLHPSINASSKAENRQS